MKKAFVKRISCRVAGWVLLVVLTGGCGETANESLLELGMLQLKEGKNESAVNLLEKAIARDPDNASAYCNLGVAQWEMGQNARAIDNLKRAGVLVPDDPHPYEFMGYVYIEGRNFKEARQAFEEADKRAPLTPRIITCRGLVEYHAGEFRAALPYLKKAIEVDRNYAPALYNMAMLHKGRKETQAEAARYYKEFLQVAARMPEEQGSEEAVQKRVRLAKEFLGMLQKSTTPEKKTLAPGGTRLASPPVSSPPNAETPANVETPLVRASASASLPPPTDRLSGSTPPAISTRPVVVSGADSDRERSAVPDAAPSGGGVSAPLAGGEATSVAPVAAVSQVGTPATSRVPVPAVPGASAVSTPAASTVTRLATARRAAANEAYDEALVLLQQAVEADEGSADALWELALLYDKRLQRPADAARIYRQFKARFPNDPRLARGARPPAAGSTSSPARMKDSRKAMDAWGRGFVLHKKGDSSGALAAYREALQFDDGLVNAWYNLGLVLWDQRQIPAAQAALNRAVELAPSMVDARYMLALVQHAQKDDARAMTHLRQALVMKPDHAKSHFLMGVIHRDAKEFDRARPYFERYLQLVPPGDPTVREVKVWLSQTPRG